jgi:tetratricopeptide (TPR) repeat protein
MENEIINEELIRKYLLDELSENDRQSIEQRIITDGEFSDRVDLVESDLVDEYARDRLEGRELQSFERIFLATPEGRKQVDFARALSIYTSVHIPQPVRPPRRKNAAYSSQSQMAGGVATGGQRPEYARYLRLAASIIIVAAVGVIVWRLYPPESETDKGIAVLKKTYSKQRPLEARLTVFDYAPYPRERGGPAQVDPTERDRAKRILRDAVMRDESDAAAHHALGLLFLSERQFDDAIREFEEALRLGPADARILSDLGAAYFERGKSEDTSKGPEDNQRGLEFFDRALALDGSRLEAIFNRALLYAEMQEWAKAEQDFRRYLELDRDSRWAEEAGEALKRIEGRKTRGSLRPGKSLAVRHQFGRVPWPLCRA